MSTDDKTVEAVAQAICLKVTGKLLGPNPRDAKWHEAARAAIEAHDAAKGEAVSAERAWREGATWAAVEWGTIPHESVNWLVADDNPYRDQS